MMPFCDRETPRNISVGDIPVVLDLKVQLERMMYFGCYEHRLLRFATSLLRPGDVAVDAGAHIGWHSLHYLRRVTREGAVHSFEPVPEHHARLSRVFDDARRLGYRCWANRVALGACGGMATMSVGNELNPGFNTLINEFSREGLRKGFIQVCVRPLDEYLEEMKVDRVGLLKVDVEGAEGLVLRGVRKALENHRIRSIIMEVSPRADEVSGHQKGDTIRHLQSLGYTGYLLDHGRPKPLPCRFDFWVADTYWSL
jgi:FkbM family methyltransferase